MDPLKEAFSRIKQDIAALRQELTEVKDQIMHLSAPASTPAIQTQNQTLKGQQTENEGISSKKKGLEDPYYQKNEVSMGNKGVQTNRPTDQQTDQQIFDGSEIPKKDPISEFRKANEILSQLDEVKREIRSTFKSLTPQEMKVFSTIYELENSGHEDITYKKISSLLGLSESSIRDYVNKIMQKGVSIDKVKHNNKTVHLHIPQNIKSIAPLSTIIQLREL